MSFRQLLARKSLDTIFAEMEGEHRLKRVLGPISLTALGIGAVIGAGIFVTTGEAAHHTAGPALMVSYVVAGITCVFAALCYAEFASMAPVAGSAYTYAYTTLGELFAWIIGWDLVLEYAVGAATVANGWSSYFQAVVGQLDNVLHHWGLLPEQATLNLPLSLRSAPLKFVEDPHSIMGGDFASTGAYINLPAVLIVAIITVILVKGISESAGFNAVMVAIKVAAVFFVIFVGAFFINPENWHPFAPFGWTGISFFGHPVHGQMSPGGTKPLGMLAGASIIFFAYIGFDAVSTQAEEAKNPQRDVPFGIIASLIICTLLYIAVVAVLTGMVKYNQIDVNAGVSDAFRQRGLPWAEVIIASAGVAGITSVLLVMMLSAPRVFLAMARDGLVPKRLFASVHPTFKTPWISTILIGFVVATLTGLLPIDALLQLTNIGTLFAFVIVCSAVLVMRVVNPQAARPFRCPLVPVVPVLGIVSCLLLMLSLPSANWYRLIAWLVIGLCIYFGYGKHHSTLGKNLRETLAHKPI
jgi:basic amino acid/polyamine antiporter, APA family